MYMCICTCEFSACEGQKTVSDPLKLELWGGYQPPAVGAGN